MLDGLILMRLAVAAEGFLTELLWFPLPHGCNWSLNWGTHQSVRMSRRMAITEVIAHYAGNRVTPAIAAHSENE